MVRTFISSWALTRASSFRTDAMTASLRAAESTKTCSDRTSASGLAGNANLQAKPVVTRI